MIKIRSLRCVCFFSLTENNYFGYTSTCEMIKYLSQINHRGAVINLINQQGARLISIIYICCRGNEKTTWNLKLHEHMLRAEIDFL